jgi:ABC-type multidrug transport system ATPase subunit
VTSNTEKGKMASLLHNVSGFFNPLEMAALMGPSGDGKTTLLDILAGRKTQGKIEGVLQFGGQKPTPAFLKRYTGARCYRYGPSRGKAKAVV